MFNGVGLLVWLADTSIWIDHFRSGRPDFAARLSHGSILTHPFVTGELACGNLRDRSAVFDDIRALPLARAAMDEEVLQLIEERKLWGQGIGWVDAHLLASALLSHCRLWTLDQRLANVAKEFRLV